MADPGGVRYRRLVARAQRAAGVESMAWSYQAVHYFAVMRSIREQPDLWFGPTSDPKIRAKSIEESINACKRKIIEQWRKD